MYPDAAQRAEELLELQHSLSDKGALGERVKPDFQSYTITMTTHAYSENPDKAHHTRRLLESLMEKVSAGDIEIVRNKAGPFSAVINAASKCESCAPTSNAVKTDIADGFTSVFETSDNAYSIAEKTFQELRSDAFGIGVKPDHHCYGAFLRCIAKHTTPGSSERDAKARMVFQEACEAGEVSRLVMDGLKEAAGKSVLAIPQLKAETLPRFWTRNVPRVFRYNPRRNRR